MLLCPHLCLSLCVSASLFHPWVMLRGCNVERKRARCCTSTHCCAALATTSFLSISPNNSSLPSAACQIYMVFAPAFSLCLLAAHCAWLLPLQCAWGGNCCSFSLAPDSEGPMGSPPLAFSPVAFRFDPAAAYYFNRLLLKTKRARGHGAGGLKEGVMEQPKTNTVWHGVEGLRECHRRKQRPA